MLDGVQALELLALGRVRVVRPLVLVDRAEEVCAAEAVEEDVEHLLRRAYLRVAVVVLVEVLEHAQAELEVVFEELVELPLVDADFLVLRESVEDFAVEREVLVVVEQQLGVRRDEQEHLEVQLEHAAQTRQFFLRVDFGVRHALSAVLLVAVACVSRDYGSARRPGW